MLILGDRQFIEANFDSESELERVVIANSEFLFGPASVYLPKTLIHTKDAFGTIPDGFAIDLASRRWFIVEVELGKHSVWTHIAPQVAKQIIAAMNPASRQVLIDMVVEQARDNPQVMDKFTDEDIEPIDIRRVLGEILDHDPIIGIPIDTISNDLRDWANTLKVKVNLWIVRKHVEFGHAEIVLYEIPEEFRPALDTEVDASGISERAQYDVTVSDLIEHGMLRSGETLTMSYKPRNGDRQTFTSIVRPSGEIEVLGKSFASPSYAAVYAMQSVGSSRSTENGWTRWRNQQNALLSDLREQYLRANGQSVGS